MLVEEIAIPHAAGAITIPFDERVTVFAGLDGPGRARLIDLLVTGLVGEGPATITVRTDEGEQGRIGPGSALEDEPEAGAMLRRLVVVDRQHLGLDSTPPDPALAGERTAASIAHRELIREVHALDAGAAERMRLVAELGTAPVPPEPPVDVTEPGPDLDALSRCAPMIDDLLRRRQEADDTLHQTRAALRAGVVDPEPWRPGDGDPRLAHSGLGTGLLAAVEVLRLVDGIDGVDPGQLDDARAAVDRARTELEGIASAAEAEVSACDRELSIIAAAADLPVGVTGPGAALTAALAGRQRRWATPEDNDPAARLLARRRSALSARIDELPDPEEVGAARRRLDDVTGHLQKLGGRGSPYDITRVRQTLIGRAAALRPDGVSAIAPLVIDEALVGLPADHLCDLLDLVLRISERAQVVVLSGDPALAVWARHRASVGDLRLVEMGAARSA